MNLHVRQSILCAMCLFLFLFLYIVLYIFLYEHEREKQDYGARMLPQCQPHASLPTPPEDGKDHGQLIIDFMLAFLYGRALVGLIDVDCPCSQKYFHHLFIPFCFHRCGGRTAEKSRLTLVDGKITQKKKTAQLASRADI